jgi:CBS-domain-containing membrane protein
VRDTKNAVLLFSPWANNEKGASAILEYNAIRSPLGQPRNALLGHTFSAIIGVAITKLFRLRSDFEKIKWIAGAVSCGTASAVMLLTGTVHPPGGASAVLAATSPEITEVGEVRYKNLGSVETRISVRCRVTKGSRWAGTL